MSFKLADDYPANKDRPGDPISFTKICINQAEIKKCELLIAPNDPSPDKDDLNKTYLTVPSGRKAD
jgi:hypothetical protein